MALAAGQGLFNRPRPVILRVNAAAFFPIYGRLSHPKDDYVFAIVLRR